MTARVLLALGLASLLTSTAALAAETAVPGRTRSNRSPS
jgi:hypothetical protein